MVARKKSRTRTAKRSLALKKKRGYASRLKVAADTGRRGGERAKALADLGGGITDNKETLHAILNILRDTTAPIKLRLDALQRLQAASFSSPHFSAARPDYLGALRTLVKDPNRELRQRVLGVLAREGDAYTQKVLLEGLEDKSKALVTPQKALQLLSYDIHNEAYPVARKIVQHPPNPTARREALRLLAADANAAPLFEKILRNKKETSEARRLSASALNSLAPKKLHTMARKIVLDAGEDPGVKAASLTALTAFSQEAVAQDAKLVKHIGQLKSKGRSPALKRIARNFLTRQRP